MVNKVSVTICMGSSCYSRGNKQALEIIREFIKTKNLNDKIDLRGAVCAGRCSNGPVISIDGKVFEEADGMTIIEELKKELHCE